MENDKIGPGVELCDPARLKLLEELQKIFGQVPQKAQAAFLLCDLDYLKGLTKASVNPVVLKAVNRSFHTEEVDEIVEKCEF